MYAIRSYYVHTFVSDCRAAIAEDKTHRAALEVVEAAFRDPAAILAAMGEPTGPGIDARNNFV